MAYIHRQRLLEQMHRAALLGKEKAQALFRSIITGEALDPLAYIPLPLPGGKRWPPQKREVLIAIGMFSAIQVLRRRARSRIMPKNISYRQVENGAHQTIRRMHVAIQQLLTLGWKKLSFEQRHLVRQDAFFESPEEVQSEWNKTIAGAMSAALAVDALHQLVRPKRRRDGSYVLKSLNVYLPRLSDDEHRGTDLIATGVCNDMYGRKRRIGLCIQVKTGRTSQHRVVITAIDPAYTEPIDVRVINEGIWEVAHDLSTPSRPFVVMDIEVGKTLQLSDQTEHGQEDRESSQDISKRSLRLMAEIRRALEQFSSEWDPTP